MARAKIRPVTRETWDDFVRLFEARGSPHFCWCVPFRVHDNRTLSHADRKACMQGLVESDTPIGVLAYDGDEPVGWCSIAPRQTFVKLERSRVMPRKTPPETPTWTVTCFFVRRPYRGKGVARDLLEGAVRYARDRGAHVVEGYPWDTAGVTATHHGHSSVFRAAGFRRDPRDRRWSLTLRSRRGR